MKRFVALLLALLTLCSVGAAFAHGADGAGVKDGDTQNLDTGPKFLNTCIVDVCEVMDVFNLVLNGVRYEAKLIDLNSDRSVTPETFDPHVEAYTGDFRAAQLADQAVTEGYKKEDMVIRDHMLYVKDENGEYKCLYPKSLYTSKYGYKLEGLDFDITDVNESGHVTLHLNDVSTLIDKHAHDHLWLHQHGIPHNHYDEPAKKKK